MHKFVFTILVLTFCSCTNNNAIDKKITEVYSPCASIPDTNRYSPVLFDTVKGDFNGDGRCESISTKKTEENGPCFCEVNFSDKTIPSIKDTGVFVFTILNEGDLDEHIGDEISVWYMS